MPVREQRRIGLTPGRYRRRGPVPRIEDPVPTCRPDGPRTLAAVRRLRGQDGKDGRGRGDPAGPRYPRRRDRHGRGIRGSLAPRDVPLSRTRAETFDDLVLDAMEDVEDAVADDAALVTALAGVELGVEDVPPVDALDRADDGAELPLARVDRATRGRPARLILYRRPIELRGTDAIERGDLVHDVVVEQLADLLDVPLDRLDPD